VDRAVWYLANTIPPKIMDSVRAAISANPKEWWLFHHYGFGAWVRGILRRAGFDWSEAEFGALWGSILERAAAQEGGKLLPAKEEKTDLQAGS